MYEGKVSVPVVMIRYKPFPQCCIYFAPYPICLCVSVAVYVFIRDRNKSLTYTCCDSFYSALLYVYSPG